MAVQGGGRGGRVALPLARAAAVSTGLRVRPHKLSPRRRAHVEEGRHWLG
jgi:hypothetical protein